jgi:predicted PurR-regulated permease PerM
MEEPATEPIAADDDRDNEPEGGVARTVLALIVATVVLYFGKNILLPLAMASMLALAFSPIAGRLETLVGRFVGAALVVLLAITAVGATGYFVTVELTAVAVDVAAYSDNIATKIAKLEGSTPAWLQSIEYGVNDVERQLQKDGSGTTRGTPRLVVAQATPPAALKEALGPAWPILAGLGEGLLIIVLFFFLLYGRRDLRDRFARLAARARIPVAAQAIESAGSTVGRYLLLVSLTNLGFGIAIGIVAWLIGLPNAGFWGGLAFLLRFIPYVGAVSAAVLPTLVAFAVFPGWSKTFEVFGSFVFLDQVTANFVEPFLIGRGISVSPVALLVSAMFWTWLWGLPGLLLATPLTACLKIAGDYIPELGFFAILLGTDITLEDHNDYYRMLLELDQSGARNLATRYCDKHGLEPTFDHILIPALNLAGAERLESNISQENQRLIIETTRDLVKDLGERFIKPRTTAKLRILGVCAPGEVHDLGLMMLLELLRHSGAAANLIDQQTPSEFRDFVKRYAPDLVCLSCTMTECLPAAAELIRDIKLDSPHITIVCGGGAALASPSELLKAGCSHICASRGDARRVMRRFALQRAKWRTIGGPPSIPSPNPHVSATLPMAEPSRGASQQL